MYNAPYIDYIHANFRRAMELIFYNSFVFCPKPLGLWKIRPYLNLCANWTNVTNLVLLVSNGIIIVTLQNVEGLQILQYTIKYVNVILMYHIVC